MHKISKKLNLPKNWVFSDKNILRNIKNKKISISSKYLTNNQIKILTFLIKNFKNNILIEGDKEIANMVLNEIEKKIIINYDKIKDYFN